MKLLLVIVSVTFIYCLHCVRPSPVAFTTCADSTGLVVHDLTIDVSPSPIRPGNTVTIVIKGIMKQTVTRGNVQLDVSAASIPFWTASHDISWLWAPSPCPPVNQPFTITKSYQLIPTVQVGVNTVRFAILDASFSNIACVQFDVSIASSLTVADEHHRIGDGRSSFHSDDRVSHLRRHATLATHRRSRFTTHPILQQAATIPNSFDSIATWGIMCPNIKRIRDAGACYSSGAIAAADSVADRFCIASNGAINASLSPQDVVTCCEYCGQDCSAADDQPVSPLYYFVKEGVVSEACLPYSVPACTTSARPCPDPIVPPPTCTKTCKDPTLDWAASKYRGTTSYYLPVSMHAIQTEIMTHGPVVASFALYADFPSYSSGDVYRHATGDYLGQMSAKIVGWGLLDGMPYWTAYAPWGADWGDGGQFKILRGSFECGIELNVIAALPLIS